VGNEEAVWASDLGHGWLVLSMCSNWLTERLSHALLGKNLPLTCADIVIQQNPFPFAWGIKPFSTFHHLSSSVVVLHM